jgi:hypothetical protein
MHCTVLFSSDDPQNLLTIIQSFDKYVSSQPHEVYIIIGTSSEEMRKNYRKLKFLYKHMFFIHKRSSRVVDLIRLVANPFYTHVLLSSKPFNQHIDLAALTKLLDASKSAEYNLTTQATAQSIITSKTTTFHSIYKTAYLSQFLHTITNQHASEGIQNQ